jgi:hypothetical protein
MSKYTFFPRDFCYTSTFKSNLFIMGLVAVGTTETALLVRYFHPKFCTDNNQPPGSFVRRSWPKFWRHASVPGLSITLPNTLPSSAASLHCYHGVKTARLVQWQLFLAPSWQLASFDFGDKGLFVRYGTRKSAKMYFDHSIQYWKVIYRWFSACSF